ncbi:MAG: bifunctional histidinol-phosphatase/imidazoleglycerol-phosphate dehydratase HisB [Cytophagaceae bacterium]|nr:bifunctional histidinol-phosphatase/imidazoleglycerol-phosphate dehydratase HisB [Cytophagaceae bacterium]MDW8457335.1 bifunctional histidinol-phosphatase/imidazoleglycerol-phosphate dehydratase HisB [Cytophagaceae bacterium]
MKKKVLFIDRDGTIIVEPPEDKQVDSLEKLEFIPGVITALAEIVNHTDYELVMVTNQDGLGTPSFPEENFWPAHNKMLTTLAGEGIKFSAIHIDKSFEHENLPTRKPGTAMLTGYINNQYDLENSYVIGDRLTDVMLAKNLGCKAILFTDSISPADQPSHCKLITSSWKEIKEYLCNPLRVAYVERITNETHITVNLHLDGTGKTSIRTGIGFFDHMLEQLAKHSHTDLVVKVKGDLHVDEHHTIEDTALALGEAYLKALGNKRGIMRYGFLLPMDDCLAQVAIDFSGRPWLQWNAEFKREKIGEMPTEMFYHFFKSFSDAAKCNLNIKAEGSNEHHKIESIFKAFAKAIKMAVAIDKNTSHVLPSTKGML